ncbi:hypothetical protein E2320_022131, partial [Naja naja]
MPGLPLLLLLFCLFPPTTAKRRQTICVLRNLFEPKGTQHYYRPGDLIIGGNLPLETFMSSSVLDFQKEPFGLLGVGFEFPQEYTPVYPSFFQINPSDFPECVGLVQLLLYFHWNWVGLVTSEDDSAESFISSLMPMLKEKEICLAFTETLKSDGFIDLIKELPVKILFKAEVIILFGESTDIAKFLTCVHVCVKYAKLPLQNVWIITSHWKFTLAGDISEGVKNLHGALQFRDHTGDVSEFSHFLLSLDHLIKEGDVFLLN